MSCIKDTVVTLTTEVLVDPTIFYSPNSQKRQGFQENQYLLDQERALQITLVW
jgi:hypothetical protein